MTFIEVLNNSGGRQAVDYLEDILASLESYPGGEKTLEELRDAAIEDIRNRFGFDYKL